MKKILLVSDTHEAWDNLREIVSREQAVDLIVHGGDFANIKDQEKTTSEAQEKGLQIFNKTVEILRESNKPVVCVPGNVRNI